MKPMKLFTYMREVCAFWRCLGVCVVSCAPMCVEGFMGFIVSLLIHIGFFGFILGFIWVSFVGLGAHGSLEGEKTGRHPFGFGLKFFAQEFGLGFVVGFVSGGGVCHVGVAGDDEFSDFVGRVE